MRQNKSLIVEIVEICAVSVISLLSGKRGHSCTAASPECISGDGMNVLLIQAECADCPVPDAFNLPLSFIPDA
jgi:hypothetical protein